MKKLLLIALILAAGMAFARSKPEAAVSAHPRAGETNRFGWTIPEKPIVITFFDRQDNPETTGQMLLMLRDYIIEEFNVELNRIVYDTDRDERLNLMLASNDYPGVIADLNDAQYSNWVYQRRAQELTDLINEYGPNIKKEVGDLYPRYLDEQGRIYGVPVNFGLLPNPGYSAHIRWDVYNEMGKPKLETLTEYYAYLKKLIAMNPTDADGRPVYALSFNDQITPDILSGFWGLRRGWKTDAATRTVKYWINTDEGLDMTLSFNRIHLDGLLDPNAFLNRYEDWKALFSAGRLVGHMGSWWHTWNAGHEVWNKAWPDWQEDQRFVQIAVKAEGVDKARLGPKNVMGGMSIITDKCENPEEVIQWWNFEITPMGTKLLNFGIPNLNNEPIDLDWAYLDEVTSVWHIDENGNWRFDEGHKQAYVNGTFDFQTLEVCGANLLYMVSPLRFTNEARPVNQWYGYNFNDEAKWDNLTWTNLKDTIFDNTALEKIPYPPEENEIVIKQQVTDIGLTGFAQAVMADSAAECERIFMDMRNRANQAGLEDLEAYVTKEYEAKVKAWGISF